ncbi:AMP-binding protein [Nocardia inohanensis]|uniref:AMP-binding protein n=1 Tax=Nocardia inohanensis TaxID=209246 RepID=UPI000A6004ED|nr:AMP-binding protein [Nocardia inohanensis]
MIDIVIAPPPTSGRIHIATLTARQSISLRELHDRAGRVAGYLRAIGLGPGDRIGILAANRLEWVLLDLAALRLGIQTAALEPGKFTPSAELLARYGLRALFTDIPVDTPGVWPIGDIEKLCGGVEPEVPPAVRYATDDVITIKFTSGSTGIPKGLGATAGSVASSMAAVQQLFAHGPGDNLLIFLPLSLLQQRYWIYSALAHGHDVTICTHTSVFAVMASIRPTGVMGVPAFFEAARREIEELAATSDSTGDAALRTAANSVFGDRIRYLWTGSAPAGRTLLDFYEAVGLPLFEGYGLNETCIVAKNHPGAVRAGSVGKVLPGKEVRIDDEGVVRVRAEYPVSRGYLYAEPGATQQVFEADGTVITGDLGRLDADGYLYILGRADDTIILGNGRKIVARAIEENLTNAGTGIAACVLYCRAEVELVAVASPAAMPADIAALTAQLARANLAARPDERISRLVVAEEPFTIDNALLTSQYKPRRQRVIARYRTALDDPQEGIHAP